MAAGGGTSQGQVGSSTTDPARLLAWVQPIVALTTGTVSGYEALARFPEDDSPVGDIFESAWATGQGPILEAVALHKALRLTGRPSAAYLAVNVSPRALSIDLVRNVLDTDLTDIVVELTEAHSVPADELRWMVSWLRDRGAMLAIDDVGTGYAGLERMICVGPDLIKLDRSLVNRLPFDRVSRVMVESLVQFAARSGAAVCAEGIETKGLLEIVAELDVSYGQGFLFGQAAPHWATPSREAVAAAVNVHRQVLAGTPKQRVFLDEVVLLERLTDQFSDADELVDAQHAVAGLIKLVGASDVAIDWLNADETALETISHHTWVNVGPIRELDQHPLLRWVLDTRRAAMVLASDPNADVIERDRMAEAGFGALLLVPVITRGATVALLSFYRVRAQPWTLAQIRMARIGASQLAATLDRLLPAKSNP